MTTENDCAFMSLRKKARKYTKARFIPDSLYASDYFI